MVLMNLLGGQSWRCRHREQTYGNEIRGGKEKVGWMGRVAWKHICKIVRQWEFAVWYREIKPTLCDSLEVWDAVGGEREIQVVGDIGISSVQLLSHVRLFVTPWTAARQASLSITNSQSLIKLISELVMPSNHLILCRPFLLLPSIFLSIRVFSN